MSGTILNLDVFEQRFRSMFKEAPFSAALLSGDDFVIEMANDATLKLWGKDESIMGKPLLQAMPEMEGQEVFDNLRSVYISGKNYEGREQTAYLNANGALTKIYVNFIFKAIHDEGEKITGVLAVGYEVTEQVLAKRKMEQLEARSRIAIETVGVGTFEKDFITGEVFSSPRFNEIFGVRNTLSHEDYISRIHPDDLPVRQAAHERGLKEGSFSYEARVLRSEGPDRHVKVTGTYLFDAALKPSKVIGTVVDVTEEKHALIALQESEQRFRTLITETPEVGVALYTGDEIRIQYVNHVMLKFWNKDASIIGKTVREALPVLSGQQFFDQFERVYKTGETYSGRAEKAYLEVNGKPEARYFNYTYKALRNPDGNIYGIHHMAVDVTDQVRNKLELIESEARVRKLFEQTPVGIAVFKGRDLNIEIVNNTMLQHWGRTREEVIDLPLWQVLPEAKDQGFDKILEHVFETGESYFSPETTVKTLRHGQIDDVVVTFTLQPIFDAEKNITGIMSISHDITEQAEARKKITYNEARLRHLANSMPQVVWIAEGNGKVTYYNDRVLAFSGVKRSEDGIWSWEGTVHPEDFKRTSDAWEAAVKDHHTYQIEHRIKMNDGSYRWHLSRAYPYATDEGHRWYGTATDVHDQKLLEMNLENLVAERTKELQRSNEDLQQFAHVASHDLKEPVRKIKTFSYWLVDEFSESLGSKGTEIVDKIIRATDRMYSMINGVLEYASLEGIRNTVQPVDLNMVIAHIKTDLEVVISEKQAVIETTSLPTITGHADQLYQLFYNLINNSLKFSKTGVPARIDLTCSIENINVQFYRITLQDNGIGFEEQFADRIFTTFVRLNAKDKYEGSGIGLALCKKIVESHGGSIKAAGTPDQGAVFTILLPRT